jgi:hypothetical protein
LSGDQAFALHSNELDTGKELKGSLRLEGSTRLVPLRVTIASIDEVVELKGFVLELDL